MYRECVSARGCAPAETGDVNIFQFPVFGNVLIGALHIFFWAKQMIWDTFLVVRANFWAQTHPKQTSVQHEMLSVRPHTYQSTWHVMEGQVTG